MGTLLGWKEVERYYSNVVQYVVMRGSTPVEEGCDVDLIGLSLSSLYLFTPNLSKPVYIHGISIFAQVFFDAIEICRSRDIFNFYHQTLQENFPTWYHRPSKCITQDHAIAELSSTSSTSPQKKQEPHSATAITARYRTYPSNRLTFTHFAQLTKHNRNSSAQTTV